MGDGNKFKQPVKNEIRTQNIIRNTATGQQDHYTTGSLVDYTSFKKYYKMIAKNLTKQQELDTVTKAMQQININGNLDLAGNTPMFILLKMQKDTILDYSQRTVLQFYFALT